MRVFLTKGRKKIKYMETDIKLNRKTVSTKLMNFAKKVEKQ